MVAELFEAECGMVSEPDRVVVIGCNMDSTAGHASPKQRESCQAIWCPINHRKSDRIPNVKKIIYMICEPNNKRKN